MEPAHGDPSSGLFEAVVSPAGAACPVKLSVFEGPLDLLLHLIRVNEVEITDIPIARIAEQYLEYLDLLRELDLDGAGEYLVMAATLAWIKSRTLLPPDPTGGEEAEGPDPRAELVARLLEYQRFKEAAGDLAARPLLGRDVFRAGVLPLDPADAGDREIEVGLAELLEAARRALLEARGPGVHEVLVESITVRERMVAVMELLERVATAEFLDLLRRDDGRAPSRALIVATFLAILELARLSALRLYQGVGPMGAPDGPLRLRRAEGESGSRWSEAVSELM